MLWRAQTNLTFLRFFHTRAESQWLATFAVIADDECDAWNRVNVAPAFMEIALMAIENLVAESVAGDGTIAALTADTRGCDLLLVGIAEGGILVPQ